jgi:hypothetical protein
MDSLSKTALDIFTPKIDEDVVTWSERNVYLPSQISPFAGYFDRNLNPYLIEPLNNFADSSIDKMTFCFASQTGKSTLMHIALLYLIANAPKPMLYLMPSDATARQISKERIQPMMMSSPTLSELIPSNQDDFTNLSFKLDDCYVHLSGSSSANKLASFPCGTIMFDECDKASVRNRNEAGAIQLAQNRIKAFGRDKLFVLASTPTIDDGQETIWHHLKNSTFKLFNVPCPSCDAMHPIQFEKSSDAFWIKYDKKTNDNGDVIVSDTIQTSRLICPSCKHEISTDEQKNEMIRDPRSKWIASNPYASESNQGYQLNSIYSSYISLQDASRLFLEAKNADTLQDFRNGFCALPWRHHVEELPDVIKLRELECEYPRGVIPKESFVVITLDFMKYEIFGVVAAHTSEGMCHIIDNFRCETFEQVDVIKEKYSAEYVACDAQYQTDYVLQKLHERGNRFLAIRAFNKMNGKFDIVPVDAFTGQTEKKSRRGVVREFRINSIYWKRVFMKLRNRNLDGLYVYSNADVLLFRHMLSEVEVESTDKNGRTIFEMKQIGENHWLDCIYYNLALGYFFRRTTSFDNKQLQKQTKRKRRPLSESHSIEAPII